MHYIKAALFALFLPIIFQATAADLADIIVSNGKSQATITLNFNERPVYSYFPLHNPERVVLDIRQSGVIKGLPLDFHGGNLLKRIRSGQSRDLQHIRLIFELTAASETRAIAEKVGSGWRVEFTIQRSQPVRNKLPAKVVRTPVPEPQKNPFVAAPVSSDNVVASPARPVRTVSQKVTVAIDAGHGGQDPGAIGAGGLKEKNVTVAIARELQTLLNSDPLFKGVMTRNGDYFISVMGRSEVARKQNANLLISIHADAAPNRSASGASVWVLSNRRANSEMANWLEQHEKQSELLGGAGDLLANSQTDPWLSQAVLDLQFGHSQRVGYDVALQVLTQLKRVGALHKAKPEHASLGVLRSPDIPSLLVETGFISNPAEEQLLGNRAYQQKIAGAIYLGLRNYFLAHPIQTAPQEKNRPLRPAAAVSLSSGSASSAAAKKVLRHKVVRGDSLSAIASHYGVSPQSIMQTNNMKSENVMIGQMLKIPAS